MYGINNFSFRGNGVAFLLVAIASISFAQVPTTNTSVNISPYVPNTTYKVVGNSAVGGLNLSRSVITSSNAVQLKLGSGSVSVVRIDPKATINAVPENKPFNARVGLNYAHDSLQKGFKDAFTSSNGVSMKMPKRGWFDVISSLPGAHAQACVNGAYDVLCWGKLEKKKDDTYSPDYDVQKCSEELEKSCFYFEEQDAIQYFDYVEKVDTEATVRLIGTNNSSFGLTCSNSTRSCNKDGANSFTVQDRSAVWTYCPRGNRYLYECGITRSAATFKLEEDVVNYCFVGSTCEVFPNYIETFVSFTAQDLDSVPLPLESMSDADFAVAQDNTDPLSISVDPIGSLVLGSTSSVDSDGNTTTETSAAEVSINNNNTSSPSLETALTTETVVKDPQGNIISSNSSTTIIKDPPTTQIQGDFLTQDQLEQTWDRKDSEAKRDSESAKIELSSEGDKYEKMTEELLKLLHVKEVDVNEVKEEYRFIFNVSKQCPAPYVMDLNFFGKQISLNFDFSFFCEFVELFGLLVLASAYLTCAYIILGLRKI